MLKGRKHTLGHYLPLPSLKSGWSNKSQSNVYGHTLSAMWCQVKTEQPLSAGRPFNYTLIDGSPALDICPLPFVNSYFSYTPFTPTKYSGILPIRPGSVLRINGSQKINRSLLTWQFTLGIDQGWTWVDPGLCHSVNRHDQGYLTRVAPKDSGAFCVLLFSHLYQPFKKPIFNYIHKEKQGCPRFSVNRAYPGTTQVGLAQDCPMFKIPGPTWELM